MSPGTKRTHLITIAPLAAALSIAASLSAPHTAPAGPISPPPGPVQPTNRNLILELPYTITQPGSYTLARDLTGVAGQHGVRIAASNVTIDLNGFTLRGVPGSLSGIFVDGPRTDVTIRRGVVTKWGGRGIDASTCRRAKVAGCQIPDNDDDGLCTGDDSEVEDTKASGNGDSGCETGDNCKVEDGGCSDNAGKGLVMGTGAVVVNVALTTNLGGGAVVGAGSSLSGCIARANTGDGLQAADGSTVAACTATANSAGGIAAGVGAAVTGCTVRGNGTDGIRLQSYAAATGNTCSANGHDSPTGAGIRALGTGARVEGNSLSNNNIGVLAASAAGRNIIIRNLASRNAVQDFDVQPTNTLGQIVTAVGAPAFSLDNPWANIVH